MKKNLLFLSFFSLLLVFQSEAQTILDFETDSTTTNFQYFASTLEPTLNNVIDNPDASGINVSAKVMDFVKPANSQPWAGAFANPAIQKQIDLTGNTDICVKVWYNEPGNLAVKLENGSAANWVDTVQVTETMQWVEICFDTNRPSIEGPFMPAAGGIYPGLVLFTDFQQVLAEDRTYYIDDVIQKPGEVSDFSVEFSVDMNDYTDTFTTVYVSGTFNNWFGDANPLDDTDGDGVWTGTVAGVTTGSHQYKFQVDQWANQEFFNGNETCTVSDGTNVNRVLSATEDTSIPTVCFGSCYECGEAINITINLGQGGFVPSAEGFFIAGGGNFGNPGDFSLVDANMSGVHTITLERSKGFSSFFTFTNGACADYSCKEMIGGQDCANPGNYNDRFMGPITQDTVINTCFEICSIDTVCGDIPTSMVTFQVDLSDSTGLFTTAFVSGTMNNWSAEANPMTDDDGDGIWMTTIELNAGAYKYKIQLDGWAQQESFTLGDPCTIADKSGNFVDRELNTTDVDQTVCFKWSTCDECEALGVNQLELDQNLFVVQPNLVVDQTTIIFNQQERNEKQVYVFNAFGQLLYQRNVAAGADTHTLDLSQNGNGLYFINVVSEGKHLTQKVLVNR